MKIVNCIAACLLFCGDMHAITVGSYTAVSRSGFVTFPAGDNNLIRGYVVMDSGFQLEDSTVTCTYSAYMPVSGPLYLNGGTLSLTRDVMLNGKLYLITGGTIACNNRAFHFKNTGTPVLAPATTGPIVSLVAAGSAPTTIQTNAWDSSGTYLASGAQNVMYIALFNGSSTMPTAATSASQLSIFNAISWQPGTNYLVSGRKTDASSKILQVWSFDPTASTVVEASFLYLGADVQSVAWRTFGNYFAACVSNNIMFCSYNPTTSTISPNYYGFTGNVSSGGLSWDSTGSYVAVGTDAGNLYVFYYDGSTIAQNAVVSVGQPVASVSYSPTAQFIAVGLTGTVQCLRLFAHDRGGSIYTGSLTERTSARVGQAQAVYSLSWNTLGTSLILGAALGTDAELKVFSFDSSATTFALLSSMNATNTLWSVPWNPDNIDFALAPSLTINVDKLAPGPIYNFVCGNAKVTFDSNITLSSLITFTGTSVINGGGNTISLQFDGGIAVGAGASLRLKNVNITHVAGSNIYCIDNASTLSLDQVTLNFDDDWSFSTGKLAVVGDVDCTGTKAFIYRSTQTSTIYDNATWYFDSGMTLSYAPLSASQSLINFNSTAACLYLYQTTLNTPSTGMKLTHGSIIIDGVCPLISAAAASSGGVILGDGLSAANNMNMRIFPGSGLVCISGFLVNNNM